VPYPQEVAVSWQLSDAERRERFEKAWAGRSISSTADHSGPTGTYVNGNTLVPISSARRSELLKDRLAWPMR